MLLTAKKPNPLTLVTDSHPPFYPYFLSNKPLSDWIPGKTFLDSVKIEGRISAKKCRMK